MKRLFPIITMVVLAMSVGCGKKDGPSGTLVAGIPVKKMTEETPITAIDKEAAQQALDRYKPRKLGLSHYVHMIERMPNNTVTGRTLFEFRNPQVQLFPEPLSEADKLNGAEWRGQIRLRADAARTYSAQGTTKAFAFGSPLPPKTTWSQWTDMTLVARWDKTKGKWIVDDLTDHTRLITFKEVEASDLPKGD